MVEDAILSLLADGPLSGRCMAKRLRVRWSEVLRELRALEAAGQVVREGRGRAARFKAAAQPGPLRPSGML